MAELLEEPLEQLGHQVPRRSGVELEPVLDDPAGDAADVFAFLVDGHPSAGVPEVCGRRQSAEPGADDRD